MLANFSNPVDVYVPMSVASVSAGATDAASKDKLTVYGVTGTYIERWAAANSIKFNSINAEITKCDYDDAWRLVPYQYIIKTSRPENADLAFKAVGGSMPKGLSLQPDGQFHGAPLETGEFIFNVAVYFTLFGNEEEYLMDLQQISLTVEEPDDAGLAGTNNYGIDDFVGEPSVPGVQGNYVLRGSRAAGGLDKQDFEVADTPEDIAAGLSNYRYFVDFWLDGRKLTRGPASDPNAAYDARDKRRAVSVDAQTPRTLSWQRCFADKGRQGRRRGIGALRQGTGLCCLAYAFRSERRLA
jgi:hypothetical protein